MATQELKHTNQTVKHFFKKGMIYLTTFCLMWSNISWAGKDILDDADVSKPLASMRPSNYLSSGVDEVTLHNNGNVLLHKNVSGEVFISPYAHPNIQKAVSSGPYNLQKFVAAHSFMVKGDAHNGYDISYTPKALGGMKKTTIGGKPYMCHTKDGIGFCKPLSSGGKTEGQGSQNSYIGTKRFPEQISYDFGVSSKDDFRLSSDKPNPYPSNFDPFKGKDDPFSHNWDPHKPNTKSHLEEFGITTTHLPTSREELEYIQQQEINKRVAHGINTVANVPKNTSQVKPGMFSKSDTLPQVKAIQKDVDVAFVSYWEDLVGKDTVNKSFVYGYNQNKDCVFINKFSGIAFPVFKQDLDRNDFSAYLPLGYTPTEQDEMMGYALAEVAAKNAGMFEEGKFVGHYFADIAKIHTLLGNSKQADKFGKEADGKFYREKALDVARMAGLSEDMVGYLATHDMPTVSGVSLHKSETIRNLINAKKYTSIAAFKGAKEDALGIGDEALKMVFNYRDESMDISARIGRAVKGLWCNTVGVCDAEASIGYTIGVGARLIGSGGKAVVGTSILGFAGRNLFENKGLPEDYQPVTRFIMEDVVPSSIKILKTPIEDMLVKLHILETWGEEEAKWIISNEKALSDEIKFIHTFNNKNEPFGPDDEYERADYHHHNSNGDKGKEPKDPKNNLPTSVQVKKTNDRVRVNADPKHEEYIVYSKHAPKKWHAHTRPWKDTTIKSGGKTTKIDGLTQEMRNALRRAGKVKPDGTIIKIP